MRWQVMNEMRLKDQNQAGFQLTVNLARSATLLKSRLIARDRQLTEERDLWGCSRMVGLLVPFRQLLV